MRYVQIILFSLMLFLSGLHQSYAQSNTPLTNFPAFNGRVRAIAVSGTTVYVGGDFTQLTDAAVNGGTVYTRNYIAAIDATSGAVLPWNPNADNTVLVLAVSGSTVYVGGSFTSIGGQSRNCIAALDAAVNTNNATAWNPNASGFVSALVVSGTTVYAGGGFGTIGGQTRSRIAALDATTNTNNATAWNPSANSFVRSLAVSGTTVYVGGSFTSIGGQSRNYIAALDAGTGNASSWNPSASNSVSPAIYALAMSGSTVYAAGNVDNIGGQSRNGVAALDASSGNATSWNPNANTSGASANVYGLAVVGTTVYTAGPFTSIGGRSRNRAAAVNASTGNALSWNPNIASAAYTVAASGGNVYVGGTFTSVGGNSAYQYFAAFGPATPSASYSATTFPEASANDGSITTTRNITLTNELWLPASAFTAGTHFTATGVPAGLTLAVTRISATVARISFTGNATAHANANDATVTLNFMDAAVASNNAAGVTGLNSVSLTLDFNDPTAAYSATTFPEAIANDGSINQTRTITLTGETWNTGIVNGTDFTAGTHFTAANVPTGLTMVIQKTSANVATVSFTGNATAHANANDVANVQITWLAAATQNIAPALITGLNGINLTLDFNDQPTAAFSAIIFPEAIANDGSITQTRTITLTGETWNTGIVNGTNFTAGTHFNTANVPAGLVMQIQKTSATVVTVSFTGNATAHTNGNDVANVQITWLAAAMQNVSPTNITGLNGVNLTLDFNDPPTAAYSATTFPEAIANDGSITQTRTVTLTGETWNSAVANGTNFTAGAHFSAANVPAGLVMQIQKTSVNVATISFTGNATAHANANDVANVQITWLVAATQNVLPANITGLNGVNLALDFIDPGGVVWSGTTFAEAIANDGSVTAVQTVSLTVDTWNTAIANGTPLTTGTHYSVVNVPTGLAMVITKNSASQVTVSFTGNAAFHSNANDISTVQITFLNTAVNSGNASGNAGLNGVLLTLDFNNPGAAALSGTAFPEVAANDGSITTTHDVTLAGDMWLPAGAFTSGTHFTATGVPMGLTMSVNRISATVARISFTGAALAHANANDATITLNFTNAALTSGNAAGVVGLNPATLTLDFNDPAVAAFSGTVFPETVLNNGTITQTRDVTLTGDMWLPAGAFASGTHFTATGVPSGLMMAITRISATVARISFTGAALAHANANDATITLNFTNAALANGNAAGVTGLNPAMLTVDFADPFSTSYSGVVFPESVANNGTITATQDVTLTGGDMWLPAGVFVSGTHFITTGVPAGLTMSVNRISATVARISFTGAAAAHAEANNTTVTLNFTNAALASGNAAAVTGLNPAMLSLSFENTPPPPPPPPIAPMLAGGTFSASVGLPFAVVIGVSGYPAPSLALSAGKLPSGISLGTSGNGATMLTGLPGEQGVFTCTLKATNSEGSASAEFTITVGPPMPLVTGISPASGTFGSTITIAGYNLAGASSVSIGGVAVQSFTFAGGSIIAIVGAPGNGSEVLVSTPLGSATGGFSYEPPPKPILSATMATIVSGDENVNIFLPGRNIPVYAGFSVTPLSSSGTVAGYMQPVGVSATSEDGATLVLPPFLRIPGTKRLTVRVGEFTVSTTFAVVKASPPLVRELTIASTTASGEAFTTILNGTGFFRFGFARIFVNGEEHLLSGVLSQKQVAVVIPAALNLRGGNVRIRIQNQDGESTEATVRVIGRNAPLITSITPRWVGGVLHFVVRGVAFSPRITAVLGRRQVTVLPGGTDTEFTVVVPQDYTAPTQGTALLMAENPDGQRYGLLIGAAQFVLPTDGTFAEEKSSSVLANGAVFSTQGNARNHALYEEFRLTPNPATDVLMLETSAFTGIGRLQMVNVRGEEVISGEVIGGTRQMLDVHALPSGVYVVRFTAGGVQAVQQVKIIR